MFSIILLKQISIMFLLMGIGFILNYFNLISEKGSKELGALLLWVVSPCVIIRSYMVSFTTERLIDFGISFLLALLTLSVNMIIAHLFYRKKQPIDHFSAAFSNAGFIGIPLVQSIFGNEAVFYMVSYLTLLNLFMWTYGVVTITKDRSNASLMKVIKNPVFIAMLIGFFLFITPFQVPSVLESVIYYMADLNTPLAMLILGSFLMQINWKESLRDISLYPCVSMRLLIIPIINLIVLLLFKNVNSQIIRIILLASCAPVGVNASIFAQQYNKDHLRAIQLVCISTVLSIFTIPIYFYFANLVL